MEIRTIEEPKYIGFFNLFNDVVSKFYNFSIALRNFFMQFKKIHMRLWRGWGDYN